MRRFAWLVAGVLALGLVAGCATVSGDVGDFSLNLSSSSINLSPGANGSVTVSISGTASFSGTVNFSVSGLPAGVTANFTNTSTSTSTTLQVNISGTVAPGTYAIEITGTWNNVTRKVTLTVTVTAPPPATTGTVTGTVSMLSGVPGDLNNAQCGLYTGLTEWANYSPAYTTTVVGSGASVSFTFTGVVPFSYYLDCWLDIDVNGVWSTGDLVAVYGTFVGGIATLTPLPVTAGGVSTASLTAVYFP